MNRLGDEDSRWLQTTGCVIKPKGDGLEFMKWFTNRGFLESALAYCSTRDVKKKKNGRWQNSIKDAIQKISRSGYLGTHRSG